ncbi:MAG: 4a-hydroxytetrahydrobiopterin dehydratase [Candidatus Cohnella colombiensis]|uniref:4a-hydroxytetrahydrobiopterin dehydratase n=1 Tax=Candidatus Cohnella colombiensis TaxID=3121368 RepID=A0AA95EWS3_9BACL|nr:MAG: 4a-hydroxytetrahydrobiopterin dehydratase [Cohnella sp.]
MKKHALLTDSELQEGLKALVGWTVEDDKWLSKKYLFPTFPEAIAFVNKVALHAEQVQHHPFISIDYRRVTLRLTTWSSGGLTKLDINSAMAYDL